jgi:hypothetical protein
MVRAGALAVTLAAAVVVALCAPPAGRAETFRPGEPHDDWTFGLIGHGVPAVLRTAHDDPYATPAAPACRTIPEELAALDAVLGPDADAPAAKVKISTRAEGLAMQGLRGMIPHRDWIRFATGANRKDKALNDAAMAGWARRGFLKGLEVNLGCGGRAGAEAAIDPAGAARPAPVVIALPPRDADETPAPVLTPAIASPVQHGTTLR